MNYYMVTHYRFKTLKVLTKQNTVNDAIRHVASTLGYSVLDLNAHNIDDLLEVSENFSFV